MHRTYLLCILCIRPVNSKQHDNSVDYKINFAHIAQGGHDMVKYHPYYPVRACTKGLSDWFCPSVCQSVSQSVCLSSEISTFTGLNSCCTWRWHGNLKKIMYVYLIESKAVHSSAFSALLSHHFDTVNHLDTVETGHIRTPSTCSHPPASSFPGLRKAGRGPENEAMHPRFVDKTTIRQVSEICY